MPHAFELPLLGSIHLLFNKENRKNINNVYAKLTKEFGPIFKFNVLGVEYVIITGPEGAKDALSNEHEYPTMPTLKIMGLQR